MEFLYWLEGLRNPVCDFFFRWITELGSETALMLVAICVFWCVNKKWGYYILTVGFFGTILSQFLKLICRVPRPWDLAKEAGRSFRTTLEDGKALGATDYSFPSGHVINAFGCLGGLALCARKTWQKWATGGLLAIAALVLVSRMWLGVHTPLDVGVGFALAAVLLLAFYPVMMKADEHPARMYVLFGVMIACCIGYICYVNFALRPEMFGEDEIDNYTSGVKNGWSLTGALLGLVLAYFVDSRYIHFEVQAPPLGQVLKVAGGVALILAIRLFGKLFPGQSFWSMPRYFLMTAAAGCLWPRTFPFWQRVGAKKEA